MTESSTFQIGWKKPKDCSDIERGLFRDLVLLGGEVIQEGFNQRINNAERLIFCRQGETIVGVAGLKRPDPFYRDGVARKSGLDLSEKHWPFEFGWAFICPGARGHHLSYRLVECALDGINCGVYSTSRADNKRMHSALCKGKFIQAGKDYPAIDNPGDIYVFLRKAGPGSPEPKISQTNQ